MELAICLLGNSNFYGINYQHAVYLSFNYHYISTAQKIYRVNRIINKINMSIPYNNILTSKINHYQCTRIEIIKKIYIEDDDGDIYTCAICYTYLLRIIQRRWRKKLELRRKIYNHSLFVNYLKNRELTNSYTHTIRDTGIIGLFYGNLVVNI